MSDFQAGQIYVFDLSHDPLNEDLKTRPCIVVQAELLDHLATLIVVPCTSNQKRRNQPTGVILEPETIGLPKDSIALTHLVYSLQKSSISSLGLVGQVSQRDLLKIRWKLSELVGIDAEVLYDGELEQFPCIE